MRVQGETIPARNLAVPTRAVNFDDYQGVRLADETKVRGDAVGATDSDWIKFADASLGSGAATFTASAAKASAGDGSIEVRLDSPTGPLAGTATVSSTGDVYKYTSTTAIGGPALPAERHRRATGPGDLRPGPRGHRANAAPTVPTPAIR